MKINKKALELIEKGLSSKTVSKLDESQINVLHKKLFVEQNSPGTTMVPRTDTTKINQLKSQKQTFQVYEREIEEDVEVSDDPNKEVETQNPEQVGPSSNDGFGNEDDGMGMFEEKDKNKPNPWAICHSQVGPKKSRKWERCVKQIKKQLGEGKNPVSLFIENQIMNIVEKNLPPRITKGDLVKYLAEAGPATAPSKPATRPTTKPGAPDKKPRPSHPGKNPNPGEKESPKAKKISAEQAKDEVIDVIMQLLQK
jgi:hypothetical protein